MPTATPVTSALGMPRWHPGFEFFSDYEVLEPEDVIPATPHPIPPLSEAMAVARDLLPLDYRLELPTDLPFFDPDSAHQPPDDALEPGLEYHDADHEWNGIETDDEGGFTDDDDDDPIPNPPTSITASTIKGLQDAVNQWARPHGFAVIRKHGRGKRNGQYTRYTLFCDRYGQPRPSESTGLRKVYSRKCGCEWKATAV
ncbi:hypothetical protein B0T16DRAFT_397028 [Cercophora newfieldiana]|uniref:FAR1 domain-containing protein n=1 Tax=Cercophora newfieldiana TaxID=92897 RepID=A0AA40CXR9_9PEZI|nr:hypothetical protein B0T16DRAFT_397028 [Cercophora newfieldiana]